MIKEVRDWYKRRERPGSADRPKAVYRSAGHTSMLPQSLHGVQNGRQALEQHDQARFLGSRNAGESASVKITTSSPVLVLMSWCRLTGVMPVIS